MIHKPFIVACVLVVLMAPLVAAQEPATAPTTRPRHQLVVPQGFKTITVGNHTALLEPADEPWVREFLEQLTPTTLPSTMPSDLLEQLTANRAQLKATILKDLALTESPELDKLLNETIPAQLMQFEEIQPPLFYMVTTGERLKELVKGGWSDPRFYYNRVADDVQMSPTVNLSNESPGDDVVIPMLVSPEDPLETKRQKFANTIHAIESELASQIAVRAQINAQVALVGFIASEVFNPMKLRKDQEWFVVGISGLLSAKYVSTLNGMPREQLAFAMMADQRNNPIRPASVDLINPIQPQQMRPQAVPYYADAYRRKSARAAHELISKAGDDAIPKIITALRAGTPADGAALVTLIRQTTGVDLSEQVKPE